MFCGSDKVDFFKREIEKYFTVKNLIVWDKGNHTAGDLQAQYGKRYEDIWKFNKVSGKEQIHQNQKPTDLLSQIIRQHTKEGDLILDPFMGSCATAVAAHRLQRNYVGFEIDPTEYATGTKWLATVKSQLSIFDFI